MEFFRIERRGAVVCVSLNQPEKRNAMGPAFWDGMIPVFAAIDADPEIRCAVLDGEGKAFSAGLDVQAMLGRMPLDLGAGPPDGLRQQQLHALIRSMQAAISSVERCRVPVVAAIHGYCIGGAVDLITACDIRLCAADAVFGVRETRLAMVPDVGTLQRLPAIVGPGRARELVYTGRDFDAETALRIGLVEQVLPDRTALLDAAFALAGQIAENPPLAVQGAKRVLVEADRARIETGLEYVATWNAAHLRTRDLGIAFAAMAARQKPEFEGR